MNVHKYFTSSKLTKVKGRCPETEQFLEKKENIRKRIIQEYKEFFINPSDNYDIEFAHYANDEQIGQIADNFQDDLVNYFQCRNNHTAAYRKVKQILINARVYVVTRYTKTKPIFDLSSFIDDNLPSQVKQVLSFVPSNAKKFLAVMDYFNSTNDMETLSQLNDFLQKGCRLV